MIYKSTLYLWYLQHRLFISQMLPTIKYYANNIFRFVDFNYFAKQLSMVGFYAVSEALITLKTHHLTKWKEFLRQIGELTGSAPGIGYYTD